MTVGEFKNMSPEERATFYDRVQSNYKPVAINSEKDSIDKTIEVYANTEISLNDMTDLQKELLTIGV